MQPYAYNLNLPWVMSFLLILHLPRLFVWERKNTSDRHNFFSCVYIYIYIYIFNFYFYCLHSVDMLRINNCVGLNIDFFGFKIIFVCFLMMGNWLSFYLIICRTLIKDGFFG